MLLYKGVPSRRPHRRSRERFTFGLIQFRSERLTQASGSRERLLGDRNASLCCCTVNHHHSGRIADRDNLACRQSQHRPEHSVLSHANSHRAAVLPFVQPGHAKSGYANIGERTVFCVGMCAGRSGWSYRLDFTVTSSTQLSFPACASRSRSRRLQVSSLNACPRRSSGTPS